MKSVNLLPTWYTRQSLRNRRLRLHVAVMLLLGVTVSGVNWLGRRQVQALEFTRTDLAHSLQRLADPEKELQQERANLTRLEDLRAARKELGNTVPMSSVVQQLRNEMKPGVSLSDLSVDVRSEPVKGSGVVGDPRNPPRYHDVAHLAVMGIAPNDQLITQFIDRISKNPLFAGVTLDFIRTGNLTGYTVRKFEIQLDMDMELLATEDPDADAPTTVREGAFLPTSSVVPDATGPVTPATGGFDER